MDQEVAEVRIIADESCPTTLASIDYKTQVVNCCLLRVATSKPPVNEIVSMEHSIVFHKVTPISVYLDHSYVGCKLSVSGSLKVNIEYTSGDEETIHFYQYDTWFHGLISSDSEGSPIQLAIDELSNRKLHVCVEYLDIDLVNSRNLNQIFVLLIWLER